MTSFPKTGATNIGRVPDWKTSVAPIGAFGVLYLGYRYFDSTRETAWEVLKQSTKATLAEAFAIDGLPVEIVSVEDGERNAIFEHRKNVKAQAIIESNRRDSAVYRPPGGGQYSSNKLD